MANAFMIHFLLPFNELIVKEPSYSSTNEMVRMELEMNLNL